MRVQLLLPVGGTATGQAPNMRLILGCWPAQATPEQPLAELLASIAQPEARGAGQVSRVREWYEPHLERLYEQAQVRSADLVQLERLAPNFQSREKFLTELALDPPAATGDLSADPHLDEDFLILSTVHSAKGQER